MTTQTINAKVTERISRLMPNGTPRYVRCYDDEGGGDRYTIVFTGHYRHKTGGDIVYIGANAHPFHPQGIGQHGSARESIDRPAYSHLGKKVTFESLPTDVQKMVRRTYVDLWDLRAHCSDCVCDAKGNDPDCKPVAS